MNISEMIKDLQNIEHMYGDIPVYFANDRDNNDFMCTAVSKIQSNHFLKWNDEKKTLDGLHSVAIIFGDE